MPDNVLETVQKVVQDVVAPDVREIKVRLQELDKRMAERFSGVDQHFGAVDQRFDSIEKHLAERFSAVDQRFGAVNQNFDTLEQHMVDRFDWLEKQMELNLKTMLSAIGELKAKTELDTMRAVSDLRERVAVLEVKSKWT